MVLYECTHELPVSSYSPLSSKGQHSTNVKEMLFQQAVVTDLVTTELSDGGVPSWHYVCTYMEPLANT